MTVAGSVEQLRLYGNINKCLYKKAETTVHRQETAHLFCGIAILDTTCPVADEAAFTSPSVPAEKRNEPSGLNDRLRQLPLWRRVRQTVSIVPRPDSEMGLPSEAVRGGRP